MVRDNGAGVPEEAHARVFELFGCARPSPLGPVRGLGLEIVKRIMDAHGGRIELERGSGPGASFRAFFPAPAAVGPAAPRD